MATESELIICSLRSWHPLSKLKKTYRLWSWESAWTSDALVMQPVADWDDDRPRSRRDTAPRPRLVVVAPKQAGP